jgi:hypothetical protein
MSDKINFVKTVYNPTQYEKVVDRKFHTFKKPSTEKDTDTIEELFRLYDKLYYEIEGEGAIFSHRYLVDKSSKFLNDDVQNDLIVPLLDEISSLRTKLLEANSQILTLTNQQLNQDSGTI